MFSRRWCVAHRGLWWPSPEKQNSLEAIDAAFRAGFGVEIDVRWTPSVVPVLALSHDPIPPDRLNPPSWAAFLRLAQDHPDCPLLINIKEPGTTFRICSDLLDLNLHEQAFLFDFELCGVEPPTVRGIQWLKRVSDRPENPFPESFGGSPLGVWVDQWDSDWVDQKTLEHYLESGPTFLVSPELHGRALDFRRLSEWTGATGLCTDVPHLIADLLEEKPELFPQNRWWGD